MKRSLLLLLLTLLICGTCNAAIHPNRIGVAGLKPGYTIQYAQSIYGPGRFVPGGRGIPTSYIFGDSLRCYFGSNIICWIVSDGNNGLTTPDGIKVGDTLDKVYSVYGKPDSTDIKLDSRTSEACREHDGKIYPIEEADTGGNVPPLHPRCRSIIVGSLGGAELKGKTRIAKSDEGNYIHIPAEMNYEDFKTVYVEKTLSESEWKQMEKNLIPASDVYISLLAKRFNLPYTIGKKDAERFYADNQAPIYPPNEGAVGEIETVDIEKDSIVLTRYGRELGSYVSPEGTSFEERSLPRETITDLSNYHRYRVLKTIKGAEKGVIAAWFGSSGGGIQYKLPVSIVRLLGEFLEELYDAD